LLGSLHALDIYSPPHSSTVTPPRSPGSAPRALPGRDRETRRPSPGRAGGPRALAQVCVSLSCAVEYVASSVSVD